MKNKSIKVGSKQHEIRTADGNLILLLSYSIPVAAWVRGRGALCSTSFFSKTTSRHVNRAVVRWQAPRVDVPQAEITALAVKVGYYGEGSVVFGSPAPVEIPRRLPDAPANVVAEVWGGSK